MFPAQCDRLQLEKSSKVEKFCQTREKMAQNFITARVKGL